MAFAEVGAKHSGATAAITRQTPTKGRRQLGVAHLSIGLGVLTVDIPATTCSFCVRVPTCEAKTARKEGPIFLRPNPRTAEKFCYTLKLAKL